MSGLKVYRIDYGAVDYWMLLKNGTPEEVAAVHVEEEGFCPVEDGWEEPPKIHCMTEQECEECTIDYGDRSVPLAEHLASLKEEPQIVACSELP